ncbi:hypothetical protein TIFTF001_009754 [Ficus carica]|uniref:Uncharacterized protein n=1 Tax=Ficus carica TaxID=3494 RepID=A0AA88CZ81_FICCA|nr:hypothetical protein TIFTF001_009754 [Ficus carica]
MTGKIFSGPAYFPVRTTRFGPASTMLTETGPENPAGKASKFASCFSEPVRTGPGQAGPENPVRTSEQILLAVFPYRSGPITVRPVRKTSE